VDKQEIDSRWLDPLLERHLGRVAAPGELLDRIEAPRLAIPGNATRRLAWTLAAAMVLVAILWGFHLRGATAPMQVASRSSGPACLACHVTPEQQTALN